MFMFVPLHDSFLTRLHAKLSRCTFFARDEIRRFDDLEIGWLEKDVWRQQQGSFIELITVAIGAAIYREDLEPYRTEGAPD